MHEQQHKAQLDKTKFNCKFCDKRFQNKDDLMKHKKEEHKLKVSVCWNYQAEDCEFQDGTCWFAYKQNNEFTSSEQFKCNTCQLTVKTSPEYLRHRKLHHIEMVLICKNIM